MARINLQTYLLHSTFDALPDAVNVSQGGVCPGDFLQEGFKLPRIMVAEVKGANFRGQQQYQKQRETSQGKFADFWMLHGPSTAQHRRAADERGVEQGTRSLEGKFSNASLVQSQPHKTK